jgi:glycolate oxidase iron-sulfur subunit
MLPTPWIFKPAMSLGQSVRPLLPKALQNKVPAKQLPDCGRATACPKMLLLDGCATIDVTEY